MPKIKFPRRINLARTPTPIEFMPRLTELFGGPEIYFKRDDLTGVVLSGNKIRKLEFSIAEALHENADVVITAGGIQSNHCRATAFVCARLGLKCHLILRGEQSGPPDGNFLLDQLAGARFSFFPEEAYSTQKPEIVEQLREEYAREGKRAYYIPVGASNAIGSWGYVRAFQEIATQADRAGLVFNHILSAVGSGGTTAGLLSGRYFSGARKPEIWGVNVCDDAETFQSEIAAILDEMNSRFALKIKIHPENIRMLDGYVGPGYAVSYPEVLDLIQTCARLEGQVLDPVYTGKALHGLGQEIRNGRFSKKEKILFIHTGGVFGIFPRKQEFRFS